MTQTALLLIPTIVVLSACGPTVDPGPEVPPATATRTAALTVENGGNLNGGNLNGGNLNGGNLNGGDLNGTDLSQFLVSVGYAGAHLKGGPVDDLHLAQTRFEGRIGSAERSGYDFVNATMVGNLGDGSHVLLWVRDIQPGPAGNEDLLQYWVEFLGSDYQWHPACRDYTGAPVWALPLAGTWDFTMGTPTGGTHVDDPGAFTFACMGGAIAKCTLFGYRPWAAAGEAPLAPFHQACTRLLRGDYCGDGMPHTQNGNRVNLYDRLGIQKDTENWFFEAEWDENGARCVYPLNRSHQGIPCVDARVSLLCGLHLQPDLGALLTNETPTAGLTP